MLSAIDYLAPGPLRAFLPSCLCVIFLSAGLTTDAAAQQPARRKEKSLGDLVARAAATEFDLPQVDDAKIAAAGIRKLTSKHLVLYTDLPSTPTIDELPAVFDQAVPQWCEYFGVPPDRVAKWKVVGCLIQDRERFLGAGLLAATLPDFLHGYQRGSQFWWYPKEGDYFSRHQMLHEGTHAFMTRWLGGAGPPWYMEGMAELLGTHAWRDEKLTMGYVPRSKEEVPFWGRVKLVRDEFAASRGLMLEDVFRYDARAHLRIEPYAWSWAACAFLDQHPLTQKAFRELKANTGDRSAEFSQSLLRRLEADWQAIREDWQLFIVNIDYGYDVAKSAVVRTKEARPLPAGGASVTVNADRGWQSTGIAVEAGRTYSLKASGRFRLKGEPKVWQSEAGGVTIRYHQGQPLGMLLAAIGDEKEPSSPITPLARPQPIGLAGEIEPKTGGTLYLKLNDSPAELADNSGTVTVEIKPR